MKSNRKKVFRQFKKDGLRNLADKTVGIGTQNQGTYATANLIKDRIQVYWTSCNVQFDQALNDLYMGRLDAFFFVGSAPVEKLNINPQAMVEGLALLPLKDFNDWAKYHQYETIHAGDYKWLENDVPTFNVVNLLVVNESKLSSDDKNKMMKLKMEIMNNYDKLKENGHPKWKEVEFTSWNKEDWPVFD